MQYLPEEHAQIYEANKHLHVPPKVIHEYMMSVSSQDGKLFDQWAGNLPSLYGFKGNRLDKYGVPIPYGLGPHAIKDLRGIAEILEPTAIFEIGLNLGYSSAMWLNLTTATVLSIDISDKDETIVAAKYLENHYPDRFKFILSDSKLVYDKIKDMKFDMIFIDGGHDEADVTSDIELGLKLGIKKFVFDDWWPCFGPGVQRSIKKFDLTITHLFSNIAVGVV